MAHVHLDTVALAALLIWRRTWAMLRAGGELAPSSGLQLPHPRCDAAFVTKSEESGTASATGSIASECRCLRHVAPLSLSADEQPAGG